MPRDKQGPLPRARETGPNTYITHREDNPTATVLSRLEKVRRSSRGWTALCPSHSDRWPSLSVSEGADGRALVWCLRGCRFADIMAALGLDLVDAFPPTDNDHRPRQRRREAAKPVVTLPRSVAKTLVETAEFAKMWEAAKALAKCSPDVLRGDVLRSWDHLTERFDLEGLLQLVNLVRGVARFRYGAADDKAVSRAVNRLVEELDREAAA